MIDPFFDEISDGICVSDDGGNLLYMNKAAERLLDTSIAGAKGKTLCELLCGRLAVGGRQECASTCELKRPDSRRDAVTFAGRHGPKQIYEWMNFSIQKRAAYQNLRVHCSRTPPSFIGEGRHLTIIENADAEVELEKQKEDWRHMVAHDLRSPLTNIYATLRLLQDVRDNPAQAPGEALIDSSVRSCEKILELLKLYLDVAKLDAGLTHLKMEAINVGAVVNQCVEEQAGLASGRRVEVRRDVPADLVVQADAELLARVVQNVLNNALKYTPDGGRVDIIARAQQDGAVLKIKDNGPGIAPEDVDFVFDRYYQAKARRDGRIQGTGLGLTFCQEALKAMGGSISVESRAGEGAEFSIRLPAPAYSR